MNKKAANFGIALLVIGVIIIGLSLVFWFSGVEKESEVYTGTVTPPEVKSDAFEYHIEFTMKSCSEVDELFNCESVSSFNRGDKIYFLINIKNLRVKKSGNNYYYEFDIEKQFKNLDTGEVIMDFSESFENIKKEVTQSDIINIHVVKELITLKDDLIGNYGYTVKMKDKISNEEFHQKVEFLLK